MIRLKFWGEIRALMVGFGFRAKSNRTEQFSFEIFGRAFGLVWFGLVLVWEPFNF